jgi:hypothetical protein
VFVHINHPRLDHKRAEGGFMLRWQVLLLSATVITTGYLCAQEVPFTSDGIASLTAKNICQLQGEFPKTDGVYLDHRKQHVVQYRERDGVVVIFLLSKPSSRNCGIVEASVNLTPLVKRGESVEFKCYSGSEGGTTWGRWGHIVGLADNHGGKKRFVRARLAWRVDLAEKRFEPITGKKVTCDTSGYEN